jgi:hypothetical protein
MQTTSAERQIWRVRPEGQGRHRSSFGETDLQLIRNATLRLRFAGVEFLIDPMLGVKGSIRAMGDSTERNPTVDLPCPIADVLEGVDIPRRPYAALNAWRPSSLLHTLDLALLDPPSLCCDDELCPACQADSELAVSHWAVQPTLTPIG